MKKADNGFKYKADKNFYEAALKNNPGAAFNYDFKNDVEKNSNRYFKFLDFTGDEKDVSRLTVLLDSIDKNNKFNSIFVKSTDIGLIQYPVTFDVIDKRKLTLFEAQQGIEDGISYYLGRNSLNSKMFSLYSMVHGEKYMYEAQKQNFQVFNEYIFIPKDLDKLIQNNVFDERIYNILVNDERLIKENNKAVLKAVGAVDKEIKRQLAVKLKDYNVGVLKNEEAFISRISDLLNEETYRYKLINNERLDTLKDDILEYDRFNLEYKANLIFMKNNIDYIPVKIERDGQNALGKTVFSVIAVNTSDPEKFAVWKKCDLKSDLEKGKTSLTRSEAEILFDGDNRKIISELIQNLIDKSGINKQEIIDYINSSADKNYVNNTEKDIINI